MRIEVGLIASAEHSSIGKGVLVLVVVVLLLLPGVLVVEPTEGVVGVVGPKQNRILNKGTPKATRLSNTVSGRSRRGCGTAREACGNFWQLLY